MQDPSLDAPFVIRKFVQARTGSVATSIPSIVENNFLFIGFNYYFVCIAAYTKLYDKYTFFIDRDVAGEKYERRILLII